MTWPCVACRQTGLAASRPKLKTVTAVHLHGLVSGEGLQAVLDGGRGSALAAEPPRESAPALALARQWQAQVQERLVPVRQRGTHSSITHGSQQKEVQAFHHRDVLDMSKTVAPFLQPASHCLRICLSHTATTAMIAGPHSSAPTEHTSRWVTQNPCIPRSMRLPRNGKTARRKLRCLCGRRSQEAQGGQGGSGRARTW